MLQPAPTTPHAALLRLWQVAQRDTGQSRVCARLLLGLYNGQRFPFDLTDLRLLDQTLLEDALAVMRMDAAPVAEVHELIYLLTKQRGMGVRFELMACDWRMKGRCSKAAEEAHRAWLRDQAEAVPA